MHLRRLSFVALLLPVACVLPPPKPSMWQLESDCANARPFIEVPDCTRRSLDEQYGYGWHAVPQANEFVDFIGATAERVRAGMMMEADGRLAVSEYASRQSAVVQALNQQQRSEQLQAGLILLQQSAQQPAAVPMPTNCVTHNGPGIGAVTTTCQ